MISNRVTELVRLQSFSVSAAALAFAFVACGGSVANHAQSDGGSSGVEEASVAVDSGGNTVLDSGSAVQEAATEAAVEAGPDTGGPSNVYPAFPIDVPQVTDNGGPILAAPVIVTVTWSTDPDANSYNTFDDAIGASTYWHAINSEYGVGAATSGSANHVSITTAPPATLADTALDTMVSTNVGTSWPADTPNTIYVIYLPPGLSFTFMGQDICSQAGGYHTETQTGNITYAVLPHCGWSQASDLEYSASHELNEAATDPHPTTNPAYYGFDDNHLAMTFFNQFQTELGDACEFFSEAADSIDMTPYTVQRQWSNKSAAAGHDWCLPLLGEPMYNTTMIPSSKEDVISVGLGGAPIQSKGFKLALNESRTFPIGFFSDQPTSGPWTIDVQGGAGEPLPINGQGGTVPNGTVNVTLDRTSGVNGEVANVTITPTAYNSYNIIYFDIRSVLPGAQQHHYLPILISQN